MIHSAGRTIPLTLAFLAIGLSTSIVRAQGYSLNPYGNSGYADYREFGTPTYANNPALPGQSRLNGEPLITRPRSNAFGQYLNGDDDGDFEGGTIGRGNSAGVPYNNAYQRLNRQYNRVYKPNDSKQNSDFVERMKQRDADFAAALKEKDPLKRAKMLRDLDNKSINSSAPGRTSKSTTASRAPEPNSNSRANSTSRAPAPPTPLSGSSSRARGNTPAPPPVPGVNSRRSTPSRGTTNTPAAPPVSGRSTPSSGGTSNSRPAPDPSTITVPPPG